MYNMGHGGVWVQDLGNGGWSPGELLPGATTTFTIDVPGAEIGDFPMVSNNVPDWPLNNKIRILQPMVVAEGKVSVCVGNFSTSPYTIPAATWYARVWKR